MANQKSPIAASGAYDAESARLDLTSGMHLRTVRHIVVALVAAFVIVALFNAQGFSKWSQKLPDNAVSEFVIMMAFQWEDWMTALGTADVFETIRSAFRTFREMVWHPLGIQQ